METLLLNSAEVSDLISIPEAIGCLRGAFLDLSRAEASVPARTILTLGKGFDDVQVLMMPACLPNQGSLSIKLSSIAPRNKSKGLPLIHALVPLFDIETGETLAILEGAALTALRTAAMSALATDLLSRPDSSRLCLIGAGAQARAHLTAISSIRQIKEVFLYSRTRARADEMARWIERGTRLTVRVRVFSGVEEAIEGADIICTTTSTASPEPIVRAGQLPAGVHINAIGGISEQACEIDPEVLRSAYTVVEQREAALTESGEIIGAIRSGAVVPEKLVEMGSIIEGKAPARVSSAQITLFKSVGLALQDTAVARAIYEKAVRTGAGKKFVF